MNERSYHLKKTKTYRKHFKPREIVQAFRMAMELHSGFISIKFYRTFLEGQTHSTISELCSMVLEIVFNLASQWALLLTDFTLQLSNTDSTYTKKRVGVREQRFMRFWLLAFLNFWLKHRTIVTLFPLSVATVSLIAHIISLICICPVLWSTELKHCSYATAFGIPNAAA